MRSLRPIRVSAILILFTLGMTLTGCLGSDGSPSSSGDQSSGGDGGGGDGGRADNAGGDGGDGGDGGGDGGITEPTGLPVLGNFSHSTDNVLVTVVADAGSGLNAPRDLDFHPDDPYQLWVVNYGDLSVTIHSDVASDQIDTVKRSDPLMGGTHFLANPSSIAFGNNGFFATCHETDQVTQPNTPADFMGPTLWTSDLSIFDAAHGGHYDMLHNSPLGMGIAWESDNTYWVFDGAHNSLTRYAFNRDHGPGGADHSDGVVARYVEGQVSRVPLVSAGMQYDFRSELLYVADPGNGRIATLNTASGTRGGFVGPNYDGTDQYEVNDAVLTTLIDGEDFDLRTPSGLYIHDGHIYVSDNDTSIVHAFDMQGNQVDWLQLDVPGGSLQGLVVDRSGNLYVIDSPGSRIIRVMPLGSEPME